MTIITAFWKTNCVIAKKQRSLRRFMIRPSNCVIARRRVYEPTWQSNRITLLYRRDYNPFRLASLGTFPYQGEGLCNSLRLPQPLQLQRLRNDKESGIVHTTTDSRGTPVPTISQRQRGAYRSSSNDVEGAFTYTVIPSGANEMSEVECISLLIIMKKIHSTHFVRSE